MSKNKLPNEYPITMISLGHTPLHPYRLWVCPSTPINEPIDLSGKTDHPYYEVMLLEYLDPFWAYINLWKHHKFQHLIDLNNRGFQTDNADQEEYRAYIARKDQVMPLWKLSANKTEKLFDMLLE